jgi:hypothetical protein
MAPFPGVGLRSRREPHSSEQSASNAAARPCSETAANNAERLDGHNGPLLSPNIDHLFDRGYISLRADDQMLLSPQVDAPEIARLGVAVPPSPHVGSFDPDQMTCLALHGGNVFLHGH